jgi:hypothetical protein
LKYVDEKIYLNYIPKVRISHNTSIPGWHNSTRASRVPDWQRNRSNTDFSPAANCSWIPKYLSQDILDHLIQTMSSRSAPDCEYRCYSVYCSTACPPILTSPRIMTSLVSRWSVPCRVEHYGKFAPPPLQGRGNHRWSMSYGGKIWILEQERGKFVRKKKDKGQLKFKRQN